MRDLPSGWELLADHFNGEGERIGVAHYPGGHPQFGHARLFVFWDDPPPAGTGVMALTLLDASALQWIGQQVEDAMVEVQ